jgi:hypothetical protein
MCITALNRLLYYLATAVYRKALVRKGFRGGPERASAFRNFKGGDAVGTQVRGRFRVTGANTPSPRSE